MKIKVKYKNVNEALALMELCRVKTQNNTWQRLLDFNLSDLRIKLGLKLTQHSWKQQPVKGNISLSRAEITAIYLNFKPENSSELVRAVYDLQITPHLHILTNSKDEY
jgi:predicted DNA binding CopG/RHH family protein